MLFTAISNTCYPCLSERAPTFNCFALNFSSVRQYSAPKKKSEKKILKMLPHRHKIIDMLHTQRIFSLGLTGLHINSFTIFIEMIWVKENVNSEWDINYS